MDTSDAGAHDGGRTTSSPSAWAAEMLRVLRAAAGLTERQWAAALEVRLGEVAKGKPVSPRTVQRWETGEAVPDADAEQAIVGYCRDKRLFDAARAGEQPITEESLHLALAQARVREAERDDAGRQLTARGAAPEPPQPRGADQERRSEEADQGRELQAFRARCGLTQDEVARVVGASSAALSQWEASRKVPGGLRRERLRELLDGCRWPALRAAMLGDQAFPGAWREAVRWYRRGSREVPARAAWGVPVGRIQDSFKTVEDLAGLRRAYIQAGPMGRSGAALMGANAEATERRVEDAAFGLRRPEIAHGRRVDLKKSVARELPLEWLRDPSTGVRRSR